MKNEYIYIFIVETILSDMRFLMRILQWNTYDVIPLQDITNIHGKQKKKN